MFSSQRCESLASDTSGIPNVVDFTASLALNVSFPQIVSKKNKQKTATMSEGVTLQGLDNASQSH